MSALERLRRAHALLGAVVLARAVLWGVATLVVVVALAATTDAIAPMDRSVRNATLALAFLLSGFALVAGAWRARGLRSRRAAALWLEERVPSLRFALVTLAEPNLVANRAELEHVVARTLWAMAVRQALVKAVAPPMGLSLLAALPLILLPYSTVERVIRPREGDALAASGGAGRGQGREGRANASHLVPLTATITPPSYTALPRLVIEEPVSIGAIIGSDILIEGRGSARNIDVLLGARAMAIEGTALRWGMRVPMPAVAVALKLVDGFFSRLVALEPRIDSVPRVTLLIPERDTVLRAPTGVLSVGANLADDFGLRATWVDLIVSSGQGENFAFRNAVLARSSLSGARTASLRARVPLDSLALAPGDVLHLRVVALDGNTVSAPGRGTSETRSIRIARAGEYDSLAVERVAPLAGDTTAISQRMLIVLTESLVRRRPRLERATSLVESRRIAVDQARLRRRVSEIIFSRIGDDVGTEEVRGEERSTSGRLTPEELLAAAEAATRVSEREILDFEGGESPVVAVNRPLLEAYNAMWDAGGELEIGEPGRAIPHMRAALEAIQRARRAERYYLRGRSPEAVVDIAAVRLAGDIDQASSARRAPGRAGATSRRLDRFTAALRVLPDSAGAAADSLLLLRVSIVDELPSAANALSDAAAALRAGRDATAALARSVRALAGEPVARSSLSTWSNRW